MTEDETLGLFIVQIGGRGYYVCGAVSEEIDRLKAIASNAIREQIPMLEEIEALLAENERLKNDYEQLLEMCMNQDAESLV